MKYLMMVEEKNFFCDVWR